MRPSAATTRRTRPTANTWPSLATASQWNLTTSLSRSASSRPRKLSPSEPTQCSYLELPYDGEVMQPLRESLERLLEAHEPNPALIVDGLWNLIESNRAASLLWDGVDPELLEPPINMLRLGVHPGGLPRISSMTAACNAPLIHRLKRRSREDADPALAKLIEEVESYLPGEPPTSPATQPVVSLRLQTPLGEVELFTVIATLGAPLDVTAANLAIETFLPMNPESAARLAELSRHRSARASTGNASG